MSFTKADFDSWLKPILEKEGVSDFTSDLVGKTEKGDGYLGDITFMHVEGTELNGNQKIYNFVLKCGKTSKELREVMPIRGAFENEIYIYEKYFPILKQFQEEKGIKEPFDNYAKCYGTVLQEEVEVLVLDNLRLRDYFLWDRKKPMNKDHIRAVIKSYGKLHALSFALREQRPEIFKKISTELQDILAILFEKANDQEVTVYNEIIEIARQKNELEFAEKISNLQEKVKSLHKLLIEPTDRYAVILHGDCWNNNFMFNYEDEAKKLCKPCLIDWQLSHLGSPVIDLSYFLFTCISSEDVENFAEINQFYYESFSDFLMQLGSDPKKLFPYEELMNQWKKFALFGLTMMPSILRICLSDTDEVVDLAEVAESGQELGEAFKAPVRNAKEYEKRSLPIVKLAFNQGFIQDVIRLD